MMNMTPTVKQLLIINILFFVCSYFVPAAKGILALHNIHSDDFAVWQLLTHMFMHGNVMHIFFNMFALISFGSALEHYWGVKKFLFFYISCGLGAAALQLGINYWEAQSAIAQLSGVGLPETVINQLVNIPLWDMKGNPQINTYLSEATDLMHKTGNEHLIAKMSGDKLVEAAANVQGVMVGASGAIYGLLVAFAFMFPNAELALLFIPIPIKAKYFVPALLCLDLFLGFKGSSLFGSSTGVAHFAHIGGAIIGFFMMWYWKRNQFNRNRWN